MAGEGKGAGGMIKNVFTENAENLQEDEKVRCKLPSVAGVDECPSSHDACCMSQSSLWRETDDFKAAVAGRHKEHIDVSSKAEIK